jgi:hypothetical protein
VYRAQCIVLLASLVIPSGFFSPQGGVIIAIPAILFAWITGTSIVLLRAGRVVPQWVRVGHQFQPAATTR